MNSMVGMRFNGPTRANQFSQTVHQSATLRQSVLYCGVATCLFAKAIRDRGDIKQQAGIQRERAHPQQVRILPPQQSTFKEIMAASPERVNSCSSWTLHAGNAGRCRQSQPHRKRGDSGFRCEQRLYRSVRCQGLQTLIARALPVRQVCIASLCSLQSPLPEEGFRRKPEPENAESCCTNRTIPRTVRQPEIGTTGERAPPVPDRLATIWERAVNMTEIN